jgi:hypothetical protein
VALNEKLTALRHEERRAALPVRRHEEEEAQGDAAVAVRGLHDAHAAYDRGDLDGAQTALEGVAALIEVSPTAAAEVDAVSVYGWLGDLATEVGNYESAALFYDKVISQT